MHWGKIAESSDIHYFFQFASVLIYLNVACIPRVSKFNDTGILVVIWYFILILPIICGLNKLNSHKIYRKVRRIIFVII
jgi:fatty-acid desaturase